jgi:hypothetical protein
MRYEQAHNPRVEPSPFQNYSQLSKCLKAYNRAPFYIIQIRRYLGYDSSWNVFLIHIFCENKVK